MDDDDPLKIMRLLKEAEIEIKKKKGEYKKTKQNKEYGFFVCKKKEEEAAAADLHSTNPPFQFYILGFWRRGVSRVSSILDIYSWAKTTKSVMQIRVSVSHQNTKNKKLGFQSTVHFTRSAHEQEGCSGKDYSLTFKVVSNKYTLKLHI